MAEELTSQDDGWAFSSKKKKDKKIARKESLSKTLPQGESQPQLGALSDALASPIFAVVVGTGDDNSRTFQLHSQLLSQESDVLGASIRLDMQESKQAQIKLDEDPALFGHFVAYLYYNEYTPWQLIPSAANSSFSNSGFGNQADEWSGWGASRHNTKPIPTSDSAPYIVLAQLYTLGDRIQAQRFKQAVLANFTANLASAVLSNEHTCQLLEVVDQELPDLLKDDPLRSQILWYAAARLEELQKYSGFDELLERLPDLARRLLQWAGNTRRSRPKDMVVPQSGSRFAKEKIIVAKKPQDQ